MTLENTEERQQEKREKRERRVRRGIETRAGREKTEGRREKKEY